jgi:hypothetical protein
MTQALLSRVAESIFWVGRYVSSRATPRGATRPAASWL